MPAGDRTGPAGMGSRSGRGMGYCSGYDAPGWANPGPGRRFYGRRGGRGGYGGGRGGRRWHSRYYEPEQPRWAQWGYPPSGGQAPFAPPSQEQEVAMLRDEAEQLKQQLDAINSRIDEISTE